MWSPFSDLAELDDEVGAGSALIVSTRDVLLVEGEFEEVLYEGAGNCLGLLLTFFLSGRHIVPRQDEAHFVGLPCRGDCYDKYLG